LQKNFSVLRIFPPQFNKYGLQTELAQLVTKNIAFISTCFWRNSWKSGSPIAVNYSLMMACKERIEITGRSLKIYCSLLLEFRNDKRVDSHALLLLSALHSDFLFCSRSTPGRKRSEFALWRGNWAGWKIGRGIICGVRICSANCTAQMGCLCARGVTTIH